MDQLKKNFINMLLAARQGGGLIGGTAGVHHGLNGAVSQTANDIVADTVDTGQAWARVPSQIMQQMQGKPITPNPEPSESAKRGQDFIQSVLMGGNVEAGAVPGNVGYIANQGKNTVTNSANAVKQGVTDVVDTARVQPGGMQAGFVKPDATVGVKTKAEIDAAKEAGLPPIIHEPQRGLPPIESGILDAKGNPISSQPKYATGNQQFNPLNPASENIPGQTPPSAQINTKPFPDVPDEPKVVTDRTGKHPVTGGNPVLVDIRDQAKRNTFYQQDQDNARAVMDKYVAGNTPLEVERNLPLQLQEESQRIKNIIAQQPKNISMDDIINANESNMAKAGITRGNSGKADTATEELLKELHSQISAGSNDVVPNRVDGQTLMDYKHLLDDRLKSVYKKNDLNTTLTPAENATLTLRRTIDQKLTELYPKTKEALNRQSAMMDARESVAKAARDEEANQLKQANVPQPNIMDKIKAHPLGAAAAAGAAGYSLPGIIHAGTSLGGDITTSIQNNQPPTNTKAKTYNVSTPLDNGSLISEQAQAQRQAKLQSIMDRTQLTDPTGAYADAKAQFDSNKLEYDSQENIRKIANDTKTLVATANNASSGVANISPSFMNVLSKGFDEAAKANGGNYAGLVADLKTLSNISGVDLSTAKSKEALQAAIDKIVANQQIKLQTAQTQFSGPANQKPTQQPVSQGLPATPQPIVNWQQNDPRVQSVLDMNQLPPLQ